MIRTPQPREILWLVALLWFAAAEAQEQEAPPPREFVGTETCLGCHESNAPSPRLPHELGQRTPEELTAIWGKPKIKGRKRASLLVECELCHGPGSLHADNGGTREDIDTFDELPSEESSSRCLRCHVRHSNVGGYKKGAHFGANKPCVACHLVHTPEFSVAHRKDMASKEAVAEHLKPERLPEIPLWSEEETDPPQLLRLREPRICFVCHGTDVLPSFRQAYRHDVATELEEETFGRRAVVKCTDCHNPHNDSRGDLKWKHEARCITCHPDVAGPFSFKHEASREEGCLTCHLPHGSPLPRMLKEPLPNLCLRCHLNVLTQGTHDGRKNVESCTTCHSHQHGSDVSGKYLQ